VGERSGLSSSVGFAGVVAMVVAASSVAVAAALAVEIAGAVSLS
jgi:hypothetical protein